MVAHDQVDSEKVDGAEERVEEFKGEQSADVEQYPLGETAEDVDEAYKLGLEAENLTYTPDEEARLLRKIDWHILPILSLVFMLVRLNALQRLYVKSLAEGTFSNIWTRQPCPTPRSWAFRRTPISWGKTTAG